MLLVACKFHMFVILVTILRKTYGYEIRHPTPEQISKTMPNVKNISHYAVVDKSLRFSGGLPGTWKTKPEPKTLDDGDKSVRFGGGLPGSWRVKEEGTTLDDGDTRRIKQEQTTLDDYVTRRIKHEQTTLDDSDTRRIEQEQTTPDDGYIRRIKQEQTTPDDYVTRRTKHEQKTLDDGDTKRIKQEQKTLDDDIDDTRRIKQKPKILDDGEQSIHSEHLVKPEKAEATDAIAITTTYEMPTGLANTEKSLIERRINKPSRKVDSDNNSAKIDLAVKRNKLNNSSEQTIPGKLHNLDEPRLETTEKPEKQGSLTEQPITETQNGPNKATEPSDPTTTLNETVEQLDVTKRPPYTLNINIPTKEPVIPVPKIGDLILTRSQAQEISKNNFNLAKYRWPDRIVPIELSASFNTREKLTILFALDMIEHHTCIKFSTRRRSDINYVQVSKRKDKPISSNLGCISGPQVVNLHVADTYDILHEFIHTLGIPHQHSVSKRDEYIRIISENIRPKLRAEFAKLGELQGYEYLNDYDRQSIMHFNEYTGSKNGNATIVAISGQIEPSAVPTDKDYDKINQLYQCE